MNARTRRLVAIALVVAICAATFVLTWVAGPVLSLLLLGTAIVIVGGAAGLCRICLPRGDSDIERMAREATKRSGTHPAGRGRVTNPADAAPLVPQEPTAAVAEPDGDLLATRRGWLSPDEIFDLVATTPLQDWWEWKDSMPSTACKLSTKLHRRWLKAQRRGQR